MDSEKVVCRILMDTAIGHGVKYVVASPGSRNTPLLIAASERSKTTDNSSAAELKTIFINDERTASFVALGMALVSQRPVMLLCTSGTALLNYSPAIAEAFYQGIPLIAVSADRPEQWIDQDDSQTIHQFEALQNFVKRSYDIPCEKGDREIEWYAERCFNDALLLSTDSKPGPVHINIQLDNPLGRSAIRPEYSPRIISWLSPADTLPLTALDSLAEEALDKKILIVAGFLPPSNSLNRAMQRINRLCNVYILAETISNIHLGKDHNAIDSILSVMDESDRKHLRPDVVITMGGALVSRMVKEFLRNHKPDEHWMVGKSRTTIDCFKSLTKNILSDPAIFINNLAGAIERKQRKRKVDVPEYKNEWLGMRRYALSTSIKFCETARWSDMKAFELIFRHLPLDYNLFLSNGTPIRYAQLLMREMPHGCFCNRGVSGIEGTNASAAGCAMAYGGRTLLVTGDLSFSYDTAILGIRELPENFKIIVVNNNGGGIFRFIETTRHLENREKFFGQNPSVPVKGLAEAYGWRYVNVSSVEDADREFPDFFESKNKTVLELCVPESYSAELLIKYMNRTKNK